MNARTRLAAIPLALVLALSIAACGSAPADEPASEPADVIEDVELPDNKEDSKIPDIGGNEEADDAIEDLVGDDQDDAYDDDALGDTQRIGTAEYGFVNVPADYIPFTDVEGGTDLQYSDATGTSIITLNVFDLESVPEDQRDSFSLYDAAQTVASNIDAGGPEDLQGATVELADRTAYQVYAFYEDGTFLVTWVVDDPEGIIHYVAVEGPDDTVLSNVELVEETYAFKS